MKTGYKVSDAMTHEPVFIGPNANIFECSKLMNEYDVGALLVKEGNKAVGICTEQDLVRKVLALEKDASKVKVKDIIDRNVKTISPDHDIFDALMKMREFNIRHLPVVKNDRIVGLLTLKDILKIEPQLFDMLVDEIELREEEKKPIRRMSDKEGVCQLCGNYSENLKKNNDGIFVCKSCR